MKDKVRLERMKNRIGVALLAAAMCLGVLAGCGSKNKSVAVYQLGEDQVVSLDSIIDEGEALLTSIEIGRAHV